MPAHSDISTKFIFYLLIFPTNCFLPLLINIEITISKIHGNSFTYSISFVEALLIIKLLYYTFEVQCRQCFSFSSDSSFETLDYGHIFFFCS